MELFQNKYQLIPPPPKKNQKTHKTMTFNFANLHNFWKSISLIIQGIGFISVQVVGGLNKKFNLAFS